MTIGEDDVPKFLNPQPPKYFLLRVEYSSTDPNYLLFEAIFLGFFIRLAATTCIVLFVLLLDECANLHTLYKMLGSGKIPSYMSILNRGKFTICNHLV